MYVQPGLFQANTQPVQAVESPHAPIGLIDNLKSIWERIISCLKKIFCCGNENDNPVQRIFYSNQKNNVSLSGQAVQNAAPGGFFSPNLPGTTQTFVVANQTIAKPVEVPTGFISLGPRSNFPAPIDKKIPYTVWEPGDPEPDPYPTSQKQPPQRATDSFVTDAERLFFILLFQKKYADAETYLKNNTGLSEVEKALRMGLIKEHQRRDKALEFFQQGKIHQALALVEKMEKGFNKDQAIIKAVESLVKDVKKYAKDIVDLMDHFDSSWKRIDALNILAKGLNVWESFSEDTSRMRIAEELFKRKEYQSAAKLIKPVNESDWGRKELAKKLAEHLI